MVKSDIMYELRQVYDGDPWYGPSIREVLESIDPLHIFDTPARRMHSIVELTAHMIAWREFTARLTCNLSPVSPHQENSFDWRTYHPDKKYVWNRLKQKMDENQCHLLTSLGRSEDAMMNQKVPGKPYTYRYLLTGVLYHDIYHLGQIVYLRNYYKRRFPTSLGKLRYSFRVYPYESLARTK